MSNSKSKIVRARSWAFIVYPDSAPENWMQQLEQMAIKALISPLHDKDENPDGTRKKAHWHVMLIYKTLKSEKQILEISEKFSGVLPQPVSSQCQYARYLVHLDNPEKYQYDKREIVQLSGANWLDSIRSGIQENQVLQDIFDWCRQNKCWDFSSLIDYCGENEPEWFEVVTRRRPYVIINYLKNFGERTERERERRQKMHRWDLGARHASRENFDEKTN